MTKKHLEIDEDLHDLIKFYCNWKGTSIKKYINRRINNLPELKAFRKRIEHLKKLSS